MGMKKFFLLLSVFSTCSYAQSLDCFDFMRKEPYRKSKQMVDISNLNCNDAASLKEAINRIIYFVANMPHGLFPREDLNAGIFSAHPIKELNTTNGDRYFILRIFDINTTPDREIEFTAYYQYPGKGGVMDRYRFIRHDRQWVYGGELWPNRKYYSLKDVKNLKMGQSPDAQTPYSTKDVKN